MSSSSASARPTECVGERNVVDVLSHPGCAGSVERIVELHDRGVIGNTPPRGDGNGGEHRDGPRVGLFKTASFAAGRDSSRQPLLADQEDDVESTAAAPPPGRPNFGAMMGGVRLQDVQLAKRSKTDRLLLDKCSMQLLSGEAAVITGTEYESKSSLLALVLGRMATFQVDQVQQGP